MQVKTKIVLTGNEWETRVAIIDDDRLVEFYIERAESQALVGRIYKGRVEKVVKGLRGAFVNIGLIPDSGGTYFLPRLLGLPRTKALMMLGERRRSSWARPPGRRVTTRRRPRPRPRKPRCSSARGA